MASDRITRLLYQKCDKWMKIPIPFNFFGFTDRKQFLSKKKKVKLENLVRPKLRRMKIGTAPLYVRISHIDDEEVEIMSDGSSLEKDPKYSQNRKQGMVVEVRFGDYQKNVVHYEVDSVPIKESDKKDPLASLEVAIDTNCDDAIKSCVSKYVGETGKELAKVTPFAQFSKEKSIRYTEKNGNKIYKRDIKRLAKLVQEISSELDSLDFVKNCQVKAYVCREERRLANSEGTKIRDSQGIAYISLYDITVRHKDGGKSTYGRPLALANSLKGLLKQIKSIKKETQRTKHFLEEYYESEVQPTIITSIFLDWDAFDGMGIHEPFMAHLSSWDEMVLGQCTTYSKKTLNQLVMGESITVTNDPTKKRGLATYKFDAEGMPAKKVDVIKNGKFVSFLQGRSSGSSNGNYRSIGAVEPEIRLSNVSFSCPDKTPTRKQLFDKFLKEIKKQKKPYGIYVRYAGGEVNLEPHGDEDMGEEEEGPYEGSIKIKPIEMYRVMPNGKMKVVSRADIVCHARQVANSLRAEYIGGPYKTFNSWCQSDSGRLLYTVKCPCAIIPEANVQEISAKGTSKRSLDKNIEE